ncbi:neuroepithelial cell-transforming gene 1 protein isoform X2 [Pocillopora verrucosa]|nr:neuroepithelial cell-transforming gene 1 protein-like isoform X4 [Pocillopora damicornis]XP_058945799.1 neuroepithelial cell-transforming gene 1 protein-like isoform X2 [Pocillopora verrucosa]XP_058945800.1 neuroepithelial cell-transforming gene 1 protein-like isoform X2 [Pocillopora verrucosa]XP_058945801.1 neuroepithelial cell-transforming gene 1 protein-like isoform X2 [Pocillopora verrucosa]
MSRTLNLDKSEALDSSVRKKDDILCRSLRSFKKRGSHLNIKNLDIKDIKKQLRKRKRSDQQDSATNMEIKEPTTKKICPVSSMTVSADASPDVAKKGILVQRSVSLRSSLTVKDSDFAKRYRLLPTPTKHRPSKSWSETVSSNGISTTLSQTEIKRQEAIYEVCTGEENVVADLKMIKEVYYAPMYKLKLMNEYEFMKIFGCLEVLLALHQDLHAKLKNARSSDGTTDSIGDIMLNWFPGLRCYARYCANQFEAKTILDEKLRQGGSVADFLQRCRDSPFSRKLDLWSFLDSPRSRLVKYPLMLRSIQKYTPKEHSDWRKLERAICRLQDIIEEVDRKTGEAKCQDVLSRIVFLDDRQMCPHVFKSKKLLCNGTLRNKHGTKLHVFLSETVFLLTRPATRQDRASYQVFTQPIPVENLLVEDLSDGDVRMGGSFKTAISRLGTAKHVFRVSSTDAENGQSHTLQAPTEQEKKQWLNAIRSVIPCPENYKTYL